MGGLSLKVLNELELEFLHLINFNCAVDDHTFAAYLDRLDLYTELNARRDPRGSLASDKENLAGRRAVGKCREAAAEEQLAAGQEGI